MAEHFGGQTLDTLAIENVISVKETDSLKLATALEQHVKHYDVGIMNLQRGEKQYHNQGAAYWPGWWRRSY